MSLWKLPDLEPSYMTLLCDSAPRKALGMLGSSHFLQNNTTSSNGRDCRKLPAKVSGSLMAYLLVRTPQVIGIYKTSGSAKPGAGH